MSDATPDFSSGVMLCLRPDDPEGLTIPGGIEADDIHCTLFYFGDTGEFDGSAADQLREVISGEIIPHGALSGEVTAWSEFGTAGESPALVLIVDAPGLGEFRADILRRIRPALGADQQPYSNHDFAAHITVAYGANEADIEAAKALVGHPLHFEVLDLEWGTESHRWELEDEEEEEVEGDAIPESGVEAGLLLDVEASLTNLQETGEMAEATEVVDATEAPAQMDVDVVDTSIEIEAEYSAEQWAEFTALPSHSTATTDTKAWSGDVAKTRTRSGESPAYYGKIYAWHDAANSPGNKTGYKFPHHVVDEAGNPGAAVTWAAKAALMLIDDSTIPAADHRGVYNHLAKHLKDAGQDVPDLGSDNASTDDVMAAVVAARVLFNVSDLNALREAYETGEWAEDDYVMGCLCTDIITFDVDEETTVEATPTASTELNLADLNDTALLGELVRRWVETATPKSVTETSSEASEYSPVAESEEITKVAAGKFEWAGIIIPEGVPSGDGRMIEEGALTWRDLPLPLMSQTVKAQGHSGSVIAGSIVELERVGNNIVGRGNFDTGPDGVRLKELLSNKTMRGVSADIDSVVMELRTQDGSPVSRKQLMEAEGGIRAMEVLVRGRIMGATSCPFPAFQEASIEVFSADDEALVASGMDYEGEVWRVSSTYPLILNGEPDIEIAPSPALVASADVIELPVIPVNPPRDWFTNQPMDEPIPFTVFPNGRIYGLLADWSTCHIGRRDKCVEVPRSTNGYSYFRNKSTLSAEGDMIATGPIIMDTVHPSLKLRASDAAAFYAHSGCAVADVAIYENEFGVVVAGALRPDVTPEKVRALRGSALSGDWRNIHGNMDLVGVLAVNVPGFPVQGLVASGEPINFSYESLEPRGLFNSVTGEMESLVAAGALQGCSTCGQHGGLDSDALVAVAEMLAAHQTAIEELTALVRPLKAEQMAARIAAMSAKAETFSLGATTSSDKDAMVAATSEATEVTEGEQD